MESRTITICYFLIAISRSSSTTIFPRIYSLICACVYILSHVYEASDTECF